MHLTKVHNVIHIPVLLITGIIPIAHVSCAGQKIGAPASTVGTLPSVALVLSLSRFGSEWPMSLSEATPMANPAQVPRKS